MRVRKPTEAEKLEAAARFEFLRLSRLPENRGKAEAKLWSEIDNRFG
jgi:hypothetical protein